MNLRFNVLDFKKKFWNLFGVIMRNLGQLSYYLLFWCSVVQSRPSFPMIPEVLESRFFLKLFWKKLFWYCIWHIFLIFATDFGTFSSNSQIFFFLSKDPFNLIFTIISFWLATRGCNCDSFWMSWNSGLFQSKDNLLCSLFDLMKPSYFPESVIIFPAVTSSRYDENKILNQVNAGENCS